MKQNNQKPQQSKSTIKGGKTIISKKKNNLNIPILIAFFFPLLLYFQTLHFGFCGFDDDSIITNNISYLSNFGNMHKAFLTDAFITKISSFYRPFQTLSFMIDLKLSGVKGTWMFHMSNMLLLSLISCSLLLLLKKFSIPNRLALLATLIYCSHPLFVSSVAWIPARGDLMLTLFSLLSFLFFIDFIQKGKKKYLYLKWAAFTIALFCKETAALIPLIFIAYYFIFSTKKSFDKKYILAIILYVVSGILWLWLRSKAIGGISNQKDAVGIISILSNLRTIPEALSKFFLLINIAPIPGFSLIKTLAGLVIMVIIIVVFIQSKERASKEKIFCLVWFLILLLPPMLYKHPVIDYLDHRFFLPLIGVLLFLLFIFPKKWLIKGDIKRYWILIAVIVILSSFTFLKSRSYANPNTFYNSAVAQNTNSALAYFGRGTIKSNTGDNQGAIEDFDKAISICPNYAEAYNNKGLAEAHEGDKDAILDYNKAIEINPKYAESYDNRGNFKARTGDNAGALKDYDKSISLNPNNAETYSNKGATMITIGNYREAITDLNKAIELNPKYLQAYCNRAIAKYNLHDLNGAIEDCEKALKINPDDENAQGLYQKISGGRR